MSKVSSVAASKHTPVAPREDTVSQVSGTSRTKSQVGSAVGSVRPSGVPSVVGSQASSMPCSNATATTVVRGRIRTMEEDLQTERKAREEAQKQLETTMQELELVEKVLKLRNIAKPAA